MSSVFSLQFDIFWFTWFENKCKPKLFTSQMSLAETWPKNYQEKKNCWINYAADAEAENCNYSWIWSLNACNWHWWTVGPTSIIPSRLTYNNLIIDHLISAFHPTYQVHVYMFNVKRLFLLDQYNQTFIFPLVINFVHASWTKALPITSYHNITA